MNILIIGGGGREHCLAWKVSASDLSGKIFAIPGNPGISQIGECISTHGIDAGSFDRIADFAEQNNIGFTIVGPEAPLVEGIVDFFNARNLKIFGPDKKAARLEGSKVFTKELSRKYKIPTAESTIFAREE
ncbi:MAG: phosphoribosylamine--glycine ligase, partial [Actinobacteria bacterium]|nr:phosphoribosylamine--glycine ligase [Actinomycetota bacterium]